MDPFVRQDPPAEYTVAEWRCRDTSVVVIRRIGFLAVQAWVMPTPERPGFPEVLCPSWGTESDEEALQVVEDLARVLAPIVLTAALTGAGSRALHLLAMREYGDVYDGGQVKLYNRTEPQGDNPWLDEIAKLEEELRTGVRRHGFKLNLDAPSLQERLCGTVEE
jgi:hypothetical protein